MALDQDTDADVDPETVPDEEPGVAERLRATTSRTARRLRRIERREVAEFSRWIEDTDNLVHLSALLIVPVLVAAVTQLSNTVALFSFLLFPPLASATYTLFSNPEGRYADPVRFVVGLTLGAGCGWAAIRLLALGTPGGGTAINPAAAAFAIFLAGVVTWGLDVEEPSAFSAALLVLAAPQRADLYVLFTMVASTLIAAVFTVWRDAFYEQRAALLYGTTRADDHVLVPMRGDSARRTAIFGARLAAAHEAGKVVLLGIVDEEALETDETAATGDSGENGDGAATDADAMTGDGAASGESPTTTGGGASGTTSTDADDRQHGAVRPVESAAATAAADLESHADYVRRTVGVPCDAVVATGEPKGILRTVVRETNSDLIVTPYEEDEGVLSTFVRSVFRDPTDSVAFRSHDGRESWRRVLVLVSRPGDSAHAMVDFATRLADGAGTVSVCTCIDSEAERRAAENRLANIVETADGPVETRVARSDLLAFVDANADAYDLVMLGSSRDRSAASRAISPPTFAKLRDLECDVAVVDRGVVE